MSDFASNLHIVVTDIEQMLVNKNRRYGNSALDPVRIFSKASPLEQLKVRMDDKLSRIRSAQDDEDEDVIDDLIGYLLLYKVAMLSEDSDDSESTKGISHITVGFMADTLPDDVNTFEDNFAPNKIFFIGTRNGEKSITKTVMDLEVGDYAYGWGEVANITYHFKEPE